VPAAYGRGPWLHGRVASTRVTTDERIAVRHYAPGLDDRLGPTLGFGRALFQGLFLAPLVVGEALRGLDFASALFAELGYAVEPAPGTKRTDVLQAIRLRGADELRAFAAGLQRALPVNARFRPEPASVPGYVDPVIMSSGAFVSGSTIDLSCDSPLRATFDMDSQGGVMYEHGVLGALVAAQSIEVTLADRSRGSRSRRTPFHRSS